MIDGSIGNPVNGLVLGARVGFGEGASVAVEAGVIVAVDVGALVLVAVGGSGVSVGEYSMSTCGVAVAGAAVTDGVLLHAVLNVNRTASDTNRVVSVTALGFIRFLLVSLMAAMPPAALSSLNAPLTGRFEPSSKAQHCSRNPFFARRL
jgi:hypothetical protein